jgi:hypothetical protein
LEFKIAQGLEDASCSGMTSHSFPTYLPVFEACPLKDLVSLRELIAK